MLKKNCKQVGVILTALGIFTLVSSLAYAADESATEPTEILEEQLIDPNAAAKYDVLKKLKENLADAQKGSEEDQGKALEQIKLDSDELLKSGLSEEEVKTLEAAIKDGNWAEADKIFEKFSPEDLNPMDKEGLPKEGLEGKLDESKMKEIEAMIKESIPVDKEMGERPSDKDIERMREEFEKNMEREPLNPDKEMFREPPTEAQIKEFERPELPPIEPPKEEPK